MKTAKTKTTGPLRLAFLAPGAPGALAFALLALAASPARATTLTASDPAEYDNFGNSVSVSGGSALVGVTGDDDKEANAGAAYYFKGLDGKSGTVNQDVKLLASDGAANDGFGNSVSVSGDRALVGAYHDADKGSNSGSAYYFKGLDNAGPTVNQNVKLTASDGAASDLFGQSVSLLGDRALVGATLGNGNVANTGAAYYYKGLDNAGPTVNQDVKLLASDGVVNDRFGSSVSLEGDSALAGAQTGDGNVANTGAAYYYKGLDNATGPTVNQDVKLLASDGAVNDTFGTSVSLSGDRALVGARGDDDLGSNAGSAYYYKGLDNATGSTVNQDVKLLASDGVANASFGGSVSLEGDSALVGAYQSDGNVAITGAAYYYKGLNGKSGTVNEDVKLIASDGAANDQFGSSVSLVGDRFVIGANAAQTYFGKAYAGDIRAFTTLDDGGSRLATDGLSFVSQGDWVIGEATSYNEVTLSRNAATGIADTANVTATGAAVYIGRNAGSDDNRLIIQGELTANAVHVGTAGSTNNTLILHTTGLVTADEVTIAANSILLFYLGAAGGVGSNGQVAAGDIVFDGMLWLEADDSFFDTVVAGDEWELFDFITGSGTFAAINTDNITLGDGLEWNFDRLYSHGIVSIVSTAAVPEPATYAAIAGLAMLAYVIVRRRR
ncbi:PEP-CTERM sorting domain-containing protein [Opitutaceae bacterium TAV4]|nr:PEP-CTERM sorting domain-containing protein [Opitutaceae bacterium TAV4]